MCACENFTNSMHFYMIVFTEKQELGTRFHALKTYEKVKWINWTPPPPPKKKKSPEFVFY